MSKYCVHLEHHGTTWLMKLFSEDRYKEVANQCFNSREDFVSAMAAIGLPSEAIRQMEEDAAEGHKATLEVEVQNNQDALASLKS